MSEREGPDEEHLVEILRRTGLVRPDVTVDEVLEASRRLTAQRAEALHDPGWGRMLMHEHFVFMHESAHH